MDVLLLLFLAATIFVGWRLTNSINVFRKSRKELDRLIQDLSRQIERADTAVAGLKNSARESGQNLQSIINDARALSEELQLMTRSGDNLATRLDRLSDRSREVAAQAERVAAPQPSAPAPASAPVSGGFAIRDREVEADDDEEDARIFAIDDDESGHSRAERELMDALKKGSRARAGGVS